MTEGSSAEKTSMVIYDNKMTMLGMVHNLFMQRIFLKINVTLGTHQLCEYLPYGWGQCRVPDPESRTDTVLLIENCYSHHLDSSHL